MFDLSLLTKHPVTDTPPGLVTDCLVTAAGGLMPWLYALRCVKTGGKVRIVDRSEQQIHCQKLFYQLLQHGQIANESSDVNSELLQEIYDHSAHIASLDVDFDCCDIIHLPNSVLQDLRDAQSPFVWFGSAFGNDDRHTTDDFAAYLTRLLQANMHVNWQGQSLSNCDCQGPRSAIASDTKFHKVHADLGLPVDAALREIADLERLGLFTSHRSGDGLHRGWSSFVLHGLGYDKTAGYEHYGHASDSEAPYAWTAEAQRHCPSLVQWFTQKQFRDRYHRVRIMRLAPWGMVGVHNDNEQNDNVWADNMAINNPPLCEMHFWDRDYRYLGQVPWADGKAIKIRIGMNHCVINRSNQVRYHLIMHGRGGWL